MNNSPKKSLERIKIVPLLALALLAGGAIAGYASFASAQTADTSSITTATSGTTAITAASPTNTNVTPKMGGHIGQNGTKEELLTGDTAAKVAAAALAAVPGATIDRVETDAEGAVYEAHMTKSDGSQVTVKFDSSYNVTATESGMGGPGHN